MLKVETFINQLMGSNCYMVWDDASKRSIVIDPASEKSLKEIDFITNNNLTLDYIFLTHEHTDHTWGVNALIDAFPDAKVICSKKCREALSQSSKAYFQLYFDDPSYEFYVKQVDLTTEDVGWHIDWDGYSVNFIETPGHSVGSVCIVIDNSLFGGDTLMPFKPFIKKRTGGSMEEYRQSINRLLKRCPLSTIVYPGHGESMKMAEMLKFYDIVL